MGVQPEIDNAVAEMVACLEFCSMDGLVWNFAVQWNNLKERRNHKSQW